MYLVFLVVLIQWQIAAAAKGMTIGPYNFDLENVKLCPENIPSMKNDTLVQYRINSTHKCFNTTAKLEKTLDENSLLYIKVDKWTNGAWKENAVTFKRKNACKMLTFVFGSLWKIIAQNSGINPGCPIQPGTYGLNNFCLSPTLSVPFMYGKFRFKVETLQNLEPVYCIQFIVNIEEIIRFGP